MNNGQPISGKHTIKKVIKSALPIYGAAIAVILAALFVPLYSFWHFGALALGALVIYGILSAAMPAKVIEIELPPVKTGDSAADDLIAEGRQALANIRRCDERIKSESVSAKIVRIETACAKIFDFLVKNPAKAPLLRRFMSYYLPTSVKLLTAYAELEAQGIEGQNITDAKTRIDQMLDKIGEAFERQLDALFGDTALDLSTDITVMENLLAQEGLASDEFTLGKLQ